MSLRKNFFSGVFLFISLTAFAQEADLEGSKDHPMLTRMNNFFIGEYETNYDKVGMHNANGEDIEIEGEKTLLHYFFNENSGQKNPSPLQILKNYDNAIRKIGGKVVHSDNNGYCVYQIKKDGHETWVKLHVVNSGFVYYLTVVELAPMEQEITATSLFEKLSTEGSVSLYINFDSGKATIKPESASIIDEIVRMLQENEDLSISIEGHTDNTGTPAINKALSLNRAKSVMSSITTKGVPATRLKTAGWGQEKPVAENNTEEGRQQNRRVDIIRI